MQMVAVSGYVGYEQSAAVERAALFPAKMRRRGKWLWKALVRPRRVEDFGAPGFAFVHDTGIFEFFYQRLFAPAK